jgi:hypothetical protein
VINKGILLRYVYKEKFSEGISKTFIIEYMNIDHYDGEEAHDRSYFTSSLGFKT